MEEIIDQEEYKERMASYVNKCIDYEYVIGSDRKFMLPTFIVSDDIPLEKHKPSDWSACEISIGFHSFIEITDGKDNIFYLILCLVNPESKKMLTSLIDTTRDSVDGRVNSKKGEFFVAKKNGVAIQFEIELRGISLNYMMGFMMPFSAYIYMKSEHCPFCRMME